MKPLRTVFAPVFISTLPSKTFSFQGRSLPYLLHRYNMTWASERCVEVPIARSFVDQFTPQSVLEVGNVLSHYGPTHHAVIDKFEKGERVINEDIVTFNPDSKFDLVVSVSTFEHIGFDDESEGSSADKINEAITSCRRLLKSGGHLVFTAPIGYNPDMDALLRSGSPAIRHETYLKKFGKLDWRQCEREEALACRYRSPFPYANAIVVAELDH